MQTLFNIAGAAALVLIGWLLRGGQSANEICAVWWTDYDRKENTVEYQRKLGIKEPQVVSGDKISKYCSYLKSYERVNF